MLTTSFILAFIILFIHACFWEGMIFGELAAALYPLPTWIKKPLFECVICMSVWWGLLLLLIGTCSGFLPLCKTPVEVAFILFCTAGINTLISIVMGIIEGNGSE